MSPRRNPAGQCPSCGCKAVRPRCRHGRTVPYRVFRALQVPADVEIPACGKCKQEFVDVATFGAIRSRLEQAYRATLRRTIRELIRDISAYVSQRRLELTLGLSQGYLSRLKTGGATPSPELVCTLALIAKDPRTRIAELELAWSTAGCSPAEEAGPPMNR